VEVAKALGGSFKLVMLALKTVTVTAQGNTKEWGHTNKSKKQMNTQNTNLGSIHKKHTRPNQAV